MLPEILRVLLVFALTLAVPFQRTLAAGAGECHHEHAIGKAIHEHSPQDHSGREPARVWLDRPALAP